MFRVARGTLVMWCLLISPFTAFFVWLLHDVSFQGLHVIELSLLGFVAVFVTLLWLLAVSAPVTMLRSYVNLTDEGISQYVPGGIKTMKWQVRWEEIEDWSFLETGVMPEGSPIWQPHIFLLSEGRVLETHAWLVGSKEAAQIAAELRRHCGSPKDLNNPLVPVYWLGRPKWRYPFS